MKALSIQQPWPWMILRGHKTVENRSWRTTRRGATAIHAGKRFDDEGYDFIRENHPEIPLPARREFDMGGIVGVANIIDCVTEHGSPFFFGPYGFVLRDVRDTGFLPCRGKLGFFALPDEIIRLLSEHVREDFHKEGA